MADLHIGTSGWNYKHWRGVFYPEGLAQKKWLAYYAEHFDTAEVNYSFYRLPKPSTYRNWVQTVSNGFLFTLKCSRIITHNKRLHNLGDLWENFINNAAELGPQLGPILCQLPESFICDRQRLQEFLEEVLSGVPAAIELRLAMEFRDQSWHCRQIYELLEKYNVAFVIADSSRYPRRDIVTADFAYFRYHGPRALFGSDYSQRQLETEAEKMSKLLSQGLAVFGYFNNDAHGYAVKDALALKRMLVGGKRKAG